jgi:succinate dehydrogenase / fumarate reductase cytochrome b subunit
MSQSPATRAAKPRPLSPHLSIYRPPITMTMSIVHRITGGALYVGTLLVAWWLTAAAGPQSYFDFVNGIFGSWIGRLILFGYTWALIHHMLGGIRHFVWDTGVGMEKHTASKIAWANIIASVVLTLAIWIVGYYARGA